MPHGNARKSLLRAMRCLQILLVLFTGNFSVGVEDVASCFSGVPIRRYSRLSGYREWPILRPSMQGETKSGA